MKEAFKEVFLTADAGNSRVSLGVFQGSRLLLRRDIPASFTRGLALKVIRNIQSRYPLIVPAVISSVNKEAGEALTALLREAGIKTVPVKSLVDRSIFRYYRTFKRLGSDRVANACYCLYLLKKPALVVDCGTTIHVDIVDGRFFRGGYIISSHQMEWGAIQAKAKGTAVKQPSARGKGTNRPGLSTVECLRNGIALSKESFVASCIDEARRCIKDRSAAAVLTGGNLNKLKNRSIFDIVDRDVTLKGIAAVYNLFRGKIC